MNRTKRAHLESADWKVGTADEFLGLTPEETALVGMKLALADHLRILRTRHSWTQADVAQRLGSSQSRVAKMEAADSSVSFDLLVKALLALGASPADVGGVIAHS